jgi:hypothetical protein
MHPAKSIATAMPTAGKGKPIQGDTPSESFGQKNATVGSSCASSSRTERSDKTPIALQTNSVNV